MKKSNNRLNRAHGFTLIEILIVVFIVVLLAGIVGPRVWDQFKKSQQKTAMAQISKFEIALGLYRLDVGKFPTTDQGLAALRKNPGDVEKWDGPYLDKALPKDPWDRDYEYESPSEHGDYAIMSLGADGNRGGEGENADIVSWSEDEE